MFVFSSTFPSEIKIQLDESFDFIGLNDYEPSFKKLITNQKQKLKELESLIESENDTTKKELLYDELSIIEKASLENILKNNIQNLLVENYGDDIVEVRLKDMYSKYGVDITDQKYVYVKGNISRANKVEYNVGGNFDFRKASKKEKDSYDSSKTTKRGIKQTILSITAGIEFYDLKTGELLYTNVFTWKTKVKTDINKPLDDDDINVAYKENIDKIFTKIIKDASRDYIPGISYATIVHKHKNKTWIIDKGSDDGFDIGKTVTLNNDNLNFSIIEASPKISLIQPKFNNSASLLNNTVKLLGNKKNNSNQPKVLVNKVEFIESNMFDKNLDYDKSTITQWFKDNLALNCDFYIVPSDPDKIYQFQEQVSSQGITSSDDLIAQLVKPNYIIFPKIIYAYSTDYFGETSMMGKSGISKLDILIELELVDINTGIIIKTIRESVSREQEQTENLISVDMNELFPELIKDGIYKLCKNLKNQFNISKVEAKLEKNKNSFKLKYKIGEPFKHGQILYLYRRNKEIKNIGWLEERVGRIKIIDKGGETFAKPLYGNLKIKSGDIIRDYSLPTNLSENIVALKTTTSNKDVDLIDIISESKTDSQSPLAIDIIRSNYYFSLVNNAKLTPVVDYKTKEFITKLRNSFSEGYYELINESEQNSKDIKIKYFANIKSVVVKKEKVHDTRTEITYALRYRLFNSNYDNEHSYESVKGLNIGIGDSEDKKKAAKEKKKRTQGNKNNKILQGLTDKDINREFFNRNLELLKTTTNEVSENI